MDKTIEAAALHRRGFNCAQSVALPFCEELGLDAALIKRAAEGFGAGMGDREQTCGALSGAILIASLKHADEKDPESKKTTYEVCARMSEAFAKQCGASVCADIKGRDGKPTCSCEECIRVGVRLAEQALK